MRFHRALLPLPRILILDRVRIRAVILVRIQIRVLTPSGHGSEILIRALIRVMILIRVELLVGVLIRALTRL